jgi:hypothetical protein
VQCYLISCAQHHVSVAPFKALIIQCWDFFFEIEDMPQPLHKKDAYDCFITLLKLSFTVITTQISAVVDMKINHRKKNKSKCPSTITR